MVYRLSLNSGKKRKKGHLELWIILPQFKVSPIILRHTTGIETKHDAARIDAFRNQHSSLCLLWAPVSINEIDPPPERPAAITITLMLFLILKSAIEDYILKTA